MPVAAFRECRVSQVANARSNGGSTSEPAQSDQDVRQHRIHRLEDSDRQSGELKGRVYFG